MDFNLTVIKNLIVELYLLQNKENVDVWQPLV